jgi:uncharacterized protein
MKLVLCPQCQKQALFSPQNPFRPFCSERCKLIDLGEWASGAYAIAQTEDPKPLVESRDHITDLGVDLH